MYNSASSVAARIGTSGHDSLRDPISITEELKKQRDLLEQEKSNLMGELNKLEKEISKAEEERKTLVQQIQTLTETNITLEAKVKSHGLEIDELKQKIIELQKELKSKDDIIESLEARITNLEEEERRVKGDQDTLYISQVAYQFEQAICSYILPEVFEKDQFATIKSLLKYLHGKSRLPIADRSGKLLLEAKERWDKVCAHLSLPTISEGDGNFTQWRHDESSTPDIIKALSLLKKNRRTIAHPRPISLKLAGEKLHSPAIKDNMPPWQFGLIEGFIVTVQKSVEKSGSKVYNKYFQFD